MDIGVPYSVTQRGFYGRSINPRTAFDQGVLEATGGQGFTRDAVGDVKRTYEQKLANYLKQLPGDPDFSGIPQKYRNTLSSYLTNLKKEYVDEASVLDQLMVGSEDYMNAVSKMNQVKAAMENLDSQFKLYGENKKSVIEDIEGQTISLYGENQENVNLLRAIYNEEYDIRIDETGSIHFIGEDGEIALNKLPDYGIKDYETAQAMMKLGSDVYRNSYKNGIALTPDDIMYHQYKNQLKMAIDRGGKNSLMSILYDGLVGDVVMANDPSMQQAIQGYKNGEMSFSTLRDITVDNYMKVLINQSKIAISKRPKVTGGGGSGSGGKMSATDRKALYEVDQMMKNFNKEGVGMLKNLLPANVDLVENTDGTYSILTGGGQSQIDTGVVIDFEDPNTFFNLMKYANINPMYWPKLKDEEEQEVEDPGGAFDNL